jgi:hypothetical protein
VVARGLRRHRTVLCCLVPGGASLGQPGLAGSRPCPLSSRTARSLVGRLRHDYRYGIGRTGGRGPPGGVGSSPLPILWWGRATPSPSPGSVPEPTPADHHRRRMMPRHRDRPLRCLVEGLLPVAPAPHRRPARIHRDDPQPVVGRHADQQVSEPPGRHPRDDAAEAPAALAAPEGLPAALAGVGETEVLDRDRPAAVGPGEPQQLGDRLPQPAVPCWAGWPSRSSGIVCGAPSGSPAGLRAQLARWSALRSTPRLRC